MNELAYQSLVVKAVKQHGGVGFKLSNRFLAGIPDLLIHLRGDYPTSLWEVKISKSNGYRGVGCWRRLPVTQLQRKFLTDFHGVGGTCGVLSFLQSDYALYMGAFNRSHYLELEVPLSEHEHLERGKREETIVRLIRNAIRRPKTNR